MRYRESHWDRYPTPGFVLTPAVKVILIFSISFYIAGLVFKINSQLLTTLGFSFTTAFHRLWLWQIGTYQIINTDIWILIFNMIGLWLFGSEIESTLGTKKFVIFLCYIGLASALIFSLSSGPNAYLISCSPALFGIIGCYASFFPERTITLLVFFVLPVEMKAKFFLAMFGIIEILLYVSAQGSSAAGWFLANLTALFISFLLFRFFGSRWLDIAIADRFFSKISSARKERRNKEQNSDIYINERVDPILEKISKQGIGSLTKKEKQILKKARTLLDKKANEKQ